MQNPLYYYDPYGQNVYTLGRGAFWGGQRIGQGINWGIAALGLGSIGSLAYDAFNDDDFDAVTSPMHSEPDDDNVIPFPIDVRDPNGSGNSDRAKECRDMCSDAHIGTGAGSEWKFRECLQDCMADPEFCP